MNIIISGASSGIGYEVALKFAANPENRIILLSRNMEKLRDLKEQANHRFNNVNLFSIYFDLENPDYAVLNSLMTEFQNIDCLFNNAGLMINKPFCEITEEEWLRIFKVNVIGQAALIREVLPFMGKESHTHIVNMSSMGGFQGSVKFAGLTAYSASKAALASLTEVLATELSERNISVNCLAIGAVNTPMLNVAFPDYVAPLTSSQIADFIAYFCQHGHHFFNGKILPVALSTP